RALSEHKTLSVSWSHYLNNWLKAESFPEPPSLAGGFLCTRKRLPVVEAVIVPQFKERSIDP
ncbi:hypothetical protein, partial [Escherichia coli]|uniref:hypothetical protein n=1 Tax=Escherichia coli TaxID=562 RepID=UPI001BDB71F5